LAALGFDVPSTSTWVFVNTPLTDPPWRFSSFVTPSGENADDQKFNNPDVEYLVGYVEGETLSTRYGLRSALADFVYAVLGDGAAGTWRITAYQPATLIRFTLGSPANLLVTDPLGRQVGFNGFTTVNQVPGATYTGPGTDPQTVTIPNPEDGTYETRVIGTGTGTYTLATEIVVSGVTVSAQSISGEITQGAVLTASVPVENPEGTPQVESILPVANPYTLTFLPPVALPDFDARAGSTIPIKFTVSSAITSAFVADMSVRVEVWYSSDEAAQDKLIQTFTYGTKGDSVRIDTEVPQYIVNWHTSKSLQAGYYKIVVVFANGACFSTLVTLIAK
jgi:hypothetical protein